MDFVYNMYFCNLSFYLGMLRTFDLSKSSSSFDSAILKNTVFLMNKRFCSTKRRFFKVLEIKSSKMSFQKFCNLKRPRGTVQVILELLT